MLLCSNLLAAQFYELWRLRYDEMHGSVKICVSEACYARNSSLLVTFCSIIPSGLMPLAGLLRAACNLASEGSERVEVISLRHLIHHGAIDTYAKAPNSICGQH